MFIVDINYQYICISVFNFIYTLTHTYQSRTIATAVICWEHSSIEERWLLYWLLFISDFSDVQVYKYMYRNASYI